MPVDAVLLVSGLLLNIIVSSVCKDPDSSLIFSLPLVSNGARTAVILLALTAGLPIG